jgi:hypothetical protein
LRGIERRTKKNTYQGDDNLTVGVSFELVRGNLSAKRFVVVYLSVDGENKFSIATDEWLSTGF